MSRQRLPRARRPSSKSCVFTARSGVRELPVDYVAEHAEHAYALTGHGMQGGTVEWAGVIGSPPEFTANWSYTALSRAREPTEVYVIADEDRFAAERAEIAPADQHVKSPLQRMAVSMRRRDDEDLALDWVEPPELPAPERLRPQPERVLEAAVGAPLHPEREHRLQSYGGSSLRSKADWRRTRGGRPASSIQRGHGGPTPSGRSKLLVSAFVRWKPSDVRPPTRSPTSGPVLSGPSAPTTGSARRRRSSPPQRLSAASSRPGPPRYARNGTSYARSSSDGVRRW